MNALLVKKKGEVKPRSKKETKTKAKLRKMGEIFVSFT